MGVLLVPFADPTAPIVFEDIAQRAAVQFTLANSAAGRKHIIEPMLGGVAMPIRHLPGCVRFCDVGKGMSAAFSDYDDDGHPDVFVANDTMPNFLFRNEGSGRLREVGLEAGVSVNDRGKPVSSMGIDARAVESRHDRRRRCTSDSAPLTRRG
jgi:VCBS repeat protein